MNKEEATIDKETNEIKNRVNKEIKTGKKMKKTKDVKNPNNVQNKMRKKIKIKTTNKAKKEERIY